MGQKTSYALAALVAGGLGYWMYAGETVLGGQGDDPESLPPLTERASVLADELTPVRVRTFEARVREAALNVRGRTEAETRVEVRAETSGQVLDVYVRKGQRVEAGDELCRLDGGVRGAQLAQAQAQLQQAQFDYDSTQTLVDRGVVAEARLRSAKATLDTARAALAAAEQEVGRVAITAPIGGIVQDPLAEIGDVLALGNTCVTLVAIDPMLAIGQVSERDIYKVEVGNRAVVTPLGGAPREGEVTYVAPTAETETRTFRIEVEVPNEDGFLRDGVTSAITLPLDTSRAHQLAASTLTLNDDGVIGVRTVGEDDRVVFMPVNIIADGRDGVWVDGLPDEVDIITVGQEYVEHGVRVAPSIDDRELAFLDDTDDPSTVTENVAITRPDEADLLEPTPVIVDAAEDTDALSDDPSVVAESVTITRPSEADLPEPTPVVDDAIEGVDDDLVTGTVPLDDIRVVEETDVGGLPVPLPRPETL